MLRVSIWSTSAYTYKKENCENLYQIYIYLQMEPYMKMAFMTARSIVQAGMLPNWDDLLSIGI